MWRFLFVVCFRRLWIIKDTLSLIPLIGKIGRQGAMQIITSSAVTTTIQEVQLVLSLVVVLQLL